MHDPHVLPSDLPVPTDDGAAAHLRGQNIADIAVECSDGTTPRLVELCAKPTVLFFYPRTGIPGQPPSLGFAGEDWNDIPGARGCTPQNCGFRDSYAEFEQLGIQVLAVSTQTPAFQRAFKLRNRIPFDYLSDSDLKLVTSMRLPTFEFPIESGGPTTLIKRMTWFVNRARIEQVWYPVFPPDENAAQVLHWLKTRA